MKHFTAIIPLIQMWLYREQCFYLDDCAVCGGSGIAEGTLYLAGELITSTLGL